ncbi:MAG: PSD1 and planctomycete cytochrome C domain-containing protein [Planctomycetota bacterium]|nr:PSD1 and planctomycete cytochrome C domain-containing protein [Planctomycetota bacterium]
MLPILTFCGGTFGVAAEEPAAKDRKLSFETDIAPLLKARCVKCHSGDEPKGGLRVASRRDLLRGGDSGPALRLAAAESSLLWEKLASNEMPAGGPALTADEKGLLRTWINDGAPAAQVDDPADALAPVTVPNSTASDHWAFRAPVRPKVPSVKSSDRVRTPIDSFVLAELEPRGLTLSPDASRETLIRRVAFDLTGLPPTPEQVEAFVSDQDPGAWERWIDQFLASPAYGERWGRHWLDLAGYADSAGVLAEDRPIPNAFRYRDYVVRAFNSNKPYDRFLQEQLAGDELTGYWNAYATAEKLPEDVIEGVIATGYLRCAPDSSRPDFSTIKNADAQYFYPTINDTMQIVASSTMGLTVQCARCHSHKYDPIPQTEFYRLQAVFMSALRPTQWVPQMDRKILVATASQKKAGDEHNAKLDAEIARRKQILADLLKDAKEKLFADRLQTLPESIREDVKQAIAVEGAQRTEIQKYLAEKFTALLRPDDATLAKTLPTTYPDYRKSVDEQNAEIAAQERQRRHYDELRALYDLPGSVPTPVLRRGDALTPGPAVEPGVLSALATAQPFEWKAPPADAPTSGRRLAFAKWLTQPDHPLTARVIVNGVWLLHFGEGLVNTPEDFGTIGSAPSHPQLLDWLAREFVESGWDVKRLHRLILNSSVYRQRSEGAAPELALARETDPDNRLLWRQRLRRLEAESVRDSILNAAGLLEHRMYGPPVPVARHGDGDVTVADQANDRRRSIYLQVLRSHPLTLLQSFDQPIMETNCTKRSRSTVSTQALTLLNSETLVRAAGEFARRILRDAPEKPLDRAVWLTYSRPVTPVELQELAAFLQAQQGHYVATGNTEAVAREQALADVCHMLLSSNEFVYVD